MRKSAGSQGAVFLKARKGKANKAESSISKSNCHRRCIKYEKKKGEKLGSIYLSKAGL